MTDTYSINGEPIARYEQEAADVAEAILAKFADPETLAARLVISVEDQVADKIAAGTRYPQVALAAVQKAYSTWARDAEAKNTFRGWKVTLDSQCPEVKPGWGIDLEGHTIPRILFLPLNPEGGVARKTGDEFAAVYHHSLSTYKFTSTDGTEVLNMSPLDGYHGIVATYATMTDAEEASSELYYAVRTLRDGPASPYTDDPIRTVVEYKAADII